MHLYITHALYFEIYTRGGSRGGSQGAADPPLEAGAKVFRFGAHIRVYTAALAGRPHGRPRARRHVHVLPMMKRSRFSGGRAAKRQSPCVNLLQFFGPSHRNRLACSTLFQWPGQTRMRHLPVCIFARMSAGSLSVTGRVALILRRQGPVHL